MAITNITKKGNNMVRTDSTTEPTVSVKAIKGLPSPAVSAVDFNRVSDVALLTKPAVPPPAIIAIAHFIKDSFSGNIDANNTTPLIIEDGRVTASSK